MNQSFQSGGEETGIGIGRYLFHRRGYSWGANGETGR